MVSKGNYFLKLITIKYLFLRNVKNVTKTKMSVSQCVTVVTIFPQNIKKKLPQAVGEKIIIRIYFYISKVFQGSLTLEASNNLSESTQAL